MKTDLVRPCLNCPFRSDSTRIVFGSRERAEEIEESAYRQGFPCHETAETREEDDDPYGEGGFYPAEDSQLCAGYSLMQLHSGGGPWPAIDNDEEVYEKLTERMDWDAPVFQTEEEFFEANTNPQERE